MKYATVCPLMRNRREEEIIKSHETKDAGGERIGNLKLKVFGKSSKVQSLFFCW